MKSVDLGDVGQWESFVAGVLGDDATLIVNMGPQHPSTHGPMRFTLELSGETIVDVRPAIGFLHTGIEKSMEYRTWTQAVTFCTRMDYVAPLFNEAVYVRAVEALLGIEDDVPQRALDLRILVMELNRITSHLVAIGTGGLEIGALTVMTVAMRERERCLDVLEAVTGLRMNHAYVRPGGVAMDLPPGALYQLDELVVTLRKHIPEIAALCNGNPTFRARLCDVGYLSLEACMALGVTGPVLRSTGYAWDLRRTQPYWGYDTYDFDVATWDTADSYGRFRIRLEEIWQSLRILEQCVRRLGDQAGPVMVADKKIAWPAQLAIGVDGLGNSADHVRHIMGESMEALIHHFKLVSEGFRVPAGQVYRSIESPRGEIGCHLVSDGGTHPYRAHMRDPSFSNLQSVPIMCIGGQVADFIVALASIDPVCGGVDR
ncbi:NADH-quinone oxidoreductase subunit D [Kribbella sp. VKM Ac-2571]|uniref:NADH-quinone oxidoreductase subunit D n=1 Tax=Kribbella sp. VKM Ac-2571 TaxID=2512222 RepID=UPI001EE14395|nr:NADH-quinone oxidoreductase subunit D [Kribbella sp. VKM Ac-2571]